MNPEQINKLAREYADIIDKLERRLYNEIDRTIRYQANFANTKLILEWLCKDHLIVEKGKVESAWLDSISDSLSDDYTTSQQCYTANKVIEHLFPEHFNQDER